VLLERSLAAHPELVAELDPERNGDVSPHAIAARSPRRLWWRCPHGHAWRARVSRRVDGSACPYCGGQRSTPERSLAAHPRLVAELDPERNGALDAATVAGRSDRRLWWRCARGHVWQATVKARVKVGSGCPGCASSHRRGILLAAQRPDLLDQWVDERNGGPPDDVPAGSQKKAWWRCPVDPRHVWQAQVRNRVRQHSGCPYCAHTRVAAETSLAATRPALAAEWHPARNHPLSPSDVLPGAGRSVWWQCQNGHAWQAPPSARLAGRACPVCAAGRRAGQYRVDRSRLEPLRRWATTHGAAPTENEWRAARMRPSVSTLYRHFDTWNAAIEAAGLDPRPRTGGIR
jgi:hypothetical protein